MPKMNMKTKMLQLLRMITLILQKQFYKNMSLKFGGQLREN